MVRADAFIAANRFGLGAGAGEVGDIGADPRGWLLAQLKGSEASPRALAGLASSREIFVALARFREQRRNAKKTRRKPGRQQPRRRRGSANRADEDAVVGRFRDLVGPIYMREAAARTWAAIETGQPFREHLVHFWANHFTVSATKPQVIALAGAFEREAIRPHVTGRFTDMLLAAVRHPAMLMYLDNLRSVGPNSRLGRRRGLGLNENLAREILELHTLGVDAGYSQDDVTEFARALTGWTVANGRRVPGTPGTFAFVDVIHEPGRRRLLGRSYGDSGREQGEAILADLARHPATARHIATKLARHFIADAPPANAVERLARTFLDSDGDLAAVSAALVTFDPAWTPEPAKVKTPNEFVVSALRALNLKNGGEDMSRKLIGSLELLGQRPFAAPSPAGWPDTAGDWVGADAVLRRAEWAMALADKMGERIDPLALADRILGPLLSRESRTAIGRAESRAQGLAMLLASPEFQRR